MTTDTPKRLSDAAIATIIQNEMARHLSVDKDGEIDGTGPASYSAARLILERLTAPPSQGKVERATSDPIAEVLVGLSRAFEAEYASMTEADVRERWYFQFDPAATLTNNLYAFHGALTLYARSCRRLEETHNGSMCVVERVRDKYLIPKIADLAAAITQALTEFSGQGTDGRDAVIEPTDEMVMAAADFCSRCDSDECGWLGCSRNQLRAALNLKSKQPSDTGETT